MNHGTRLGCWLAIGLAGCAGGAATGDTTEDTASFDACAAFDEPRTTNVEYSCPGGGKASDLVTRLELADATDTTCGLCGVGDIDATLTVYNPCSVNVDYDGRCLFSDLALTGPITGWDEIVDCYEYASTLTYATVPASTRTVLYTERMRLTDPGAYTLSYNLRPLPDVRRRFCLE